MQPKGGEEMLSAWINAKQELPENGELVLAVKLLKNGTRDICLARCIRNYEFYDPVNKVRYTGNYWACGGSNNVVMWMPLPGIPEDNEN